MMPILPQTSSETPPRAGVLLLAAVGLLAGCAGQPVSHGTSISRWTQLGAQDTISLRAIVAAADACPTAIVDGRPRPLLPRSRATPPHTPARDNPAFEPDFAVVSCELDLPRSARQASIDGHAMPMPGTDHPQRIVVIGDTGCRVKVPADSPGDPIQDCSSPTDWPWQRIALAAARTQPDLVIHLGDYHYREYCKQPALCSRLRENGVVVGYDWAGWHADFFAPATPLLAAAAWVTVRGNHEDCDRGGEGWMRFLSPLPYQACPNQRLKTDSHSVLANNLTADAYRIDLGGKLTLVVADNAGHEDYRPATPQEVGIFTRTLSALTTLSALPQASPVWLLLHRPIWYDGLDAAAPPNALQTALAGKLPANVQFVFAGHQHAFQTINFAPTADPVHYPAGRPAQVVIGASGTQLEALDPESPVYEGKVGPGGMERAQPDGRLYDGVAASSGIFLNRYSFLLLELDDSGWVGTLLDADGKTISRCRLNGERKEIACSFPGA
ncbi:MAG: metallophosphoesterase [Candidatus Accumulibacter sp.]|uniref:metallophosphoesterase n=1 Tax=Accumulibacter sp. TaxID=2053492 RepID=UPI00258B2ED2|nr:metallophosphoesterase [Accumulibacter sp.]MCM8620691.1 metallophosphoesterase [Accumulibacter sp.]